MKVLHPMRIVLIFCLFRQTKPRRRENDQSRGLTAPRHSSECVRKKITVSTMILITIAKRIFFVNGLVHTSVGFALSAIPAVLPVPG
jgi:hypothetical protein